LQQYDLLVASLIKRYTFHAGDIAIGEAFCAKQVLGEIEGEVKGKKSMIYWR